MISQKILSIFTLFFSFLIFNFATSNSNINPLLNSLTINSPETELPSEPYLPTPPGPLIPEPIEKPIYEEPKLPEEDDIHIPEKNYLVIILASISVFGVIIISLVSFYVIKTLKKRKNSIEVE